MRPTYLLTLALLLPAAYAHAAPPKPDFADLPAYLNALNRSTDPEARAIRRRIVSGPADLARERAAAEREGLLTRPSQLQQPLPPADQNAAPLYLQLDALRKQKPLHLPEYASPLNSRWSYTPEQLAAVQKEVDARQDIFTLLHEATDKPQCVFTQDRPLDFHFPEYFGLYENQYEITTESLLMAYKGEYSEAIADQERGFRIADHVTSEPLLLPLVTGSAIEADTLTWMQGILKLAGPKAALDTRVEKDVLARQDAPNYFTLSHALRGEPAVDDTRFSRLRQANPADVRQSFRSESPFLGKHPAPVSTRFTPSEAAQFGELLDAAHANYFHQMRRIIAAADLPNAGRLEVFTQVEALTHTHENDPIEALSDQINPLLVWDASTEFMHEHYMHPLLPIYQPVNSIIARRLVTAAGAAVLAAKAQTGAFPLTLPPQFVDPFTERSLGYHLEGTSGFVVYSAGPGGTFDGGKPGDKGDYGHILFRYPLVPVPIPADMLKSSYDSFS